MLFGCGYRPLHSARPFERFAVVGGAPLVADAAVVAEVEAGLRAGLARAGALREGRAWPRVVVEVLQIETESVGIAAREGIPVARGTGLGIVAHAWIERAQGEPAADRQVFEKRAEEVAAVEARALSESLREESARFRAARRLGEELARTVLAAPP